MRAAELPMGARVAIETMAVVGAGQMGSWDRPGGRTGGAEGDPGGRLAGAGQEGPRQAGRRAGQAGGEGEAAGGRPRGGPGAHPPRRQPRRLRPRRPGHRGHRREPAGQGRGLQEAGRHAAPRGAARLQHQLHLHHRAGRRDQASHPVHRDALHEPAAGDGAHRDHPRAADLRRDLPGDHGAGEEVRQDGGDVQGRARLHRQPDPHPAHQRGLLRAAGGAGVARGHRHRRQARPQPPWGR